MLVAHVVAPEVRHAHARMGERCQLRRLIDVLILRTGAEQHERQQRGACGECWFEGLWYAHGYLAAADAVAAAAGVLVAAAAGVLAAAAGGVAPFNRSAIFNCSSALS